MISTLRKSGAIGLGLFLAGPVLLAFHPDNNRSPLPDLDRRPALVPAAAAVPAAAGPGVAAPASDLRMDRNGKSGSRFIRSAEGFLTGPNGTGRHVSNRAAAAVAVADPDRGLKAFLGENRGWVGHGPEALDKARITREDVNVRNGLRSVAWQQQVDGIPVFESVLTAHTTRSGELVNLATAFLPDPAGATDAAARQVLAGPGPAVGPARAVSTAAAAIGVSLPENGVTADPPPEAGAERIGFYRGAGLSGQTRAGLAWLPVSGNLRLCWDVILTSRARGEMFRVLVDAQTGETWLRRSLTSHASLASYRVYTSDSPSPMSPGLSTPSNYQPPVVPRDLVTWVAQSTTASPEGWIPDGQNTTAGNNVDAHLDRDDDDAADAGSRPNGSPYRMFDFPLDLSLAPSNYMKASVVQLFYLNNWMHDRLYELGFTESAGNFQSDNFGRGGLGGDPVQADGMDGSGVNNANFQTPPDGLPPRMQMYLFSGPTPDRDGSLDSEIVLHEYTHGLSGRLVGGGVGISSLQSGGLGEGWSDFYPMCLLSDPSDDPNACYACGGYATYSFYGLAQNYYFGIRRYPYSTDMTKNPLTFKDIDPDQALDHDSVPMSPIGGGSADEVHNMGEVWCVTLWEARANLIAKHGAAAGNQMILELVTDGMKLAPANPTFLQARDAIIQADQVNNGGANFIELWTAFAKRGMGAGAYAPDSDSAYGVVESFAMPDTLQVMPSAGWNATGWQGGPFAPTSRVYQLRNASQGVIQWSASASVAWLSVGTITGTLAVGQTVSVGTGLRLSVQSLPPGSYSGDIRFRNLTSGITQSFTVRLTVKEIPGVIDVRDSLDPEGDLDLPFRAVAPGFSQTETVTVSNADNLHDLVVTGVGFGYFKEDFGDGLAQNWVPEVPANWSVSNSEYKAYAHALERIMQSSFTGERWADGKFSVKITQVGGSSFSSILALRATDDFSWKSSRGSAYLIGLVGEGYFFVGKYVDGLFSMLQSWSYSPSISRTYNRVDCSLVGNSISVTINGALVCTGTDDSIPAAGRLVLMGYSGQGKEVIHQFDDVIVGQVLTGGSLSASQRWYNKHASDSADPLALPEGFAPPAFEGEDEEGRPPTASLTATTNGTFLLENVPAFPVRLTPGQTLSFQASFNPVNYDSNKNTIIIRSRDMDNPETSLTISGWGAPNRLSVLPAKWWFFEAQPAGSYGYCTSRYAVINTGSTGVNWAVTGLPAWLSVQPSSGYLPGYGSNDVLVSVTPAAGTLPEGVYSNAIAFRNVAVGGLSSRGVVLTIRKSPKLDLHPDAFSVTNNAGGKVPVKMTLGNSGQLELVWTLRMPNDRQTSDFEGGAGSWTHSGTADPWHLTTLRSSSGSRSWYAGSDATRQYANNVNASLFSQSFTVTPRSRLQFKHWYVMENASDVGYVEITTNGTIYETIASFSGSNPVWTAESADLSPYAGTTARIRFRFRSNSMVSNFEGWYVDDVNLEPVGVPAGNVVSASAMAGTVSPDGSESVILTFDSGAAALGQVLSGQLKLECNDVMAPTTLLPYRLEVAGPLTLSAPARVREGAGLLAGGGSVSLGASAVEDTVVHLVSSDPGKVAVPETVTVPAGQSLALFNLVVGDDTALDGLQSVYLSAYSDRFGQATVLVDDNESTNLTLALPAGAYEGQNLVNAGRVTIGGTLGRDLAVALTSSDTGEWVMPATAVVPAGHTSALFTVTLPADGLMDGAQTGTAWAAAAGFVPASAPFVTRDRDVHHYAFSALTGTRLAGIAFPITLTACDTNNQVIEVCRDAVSLAAAGRAGALTVQPTNVTLASGSWAGTLTLRPPDKAVTVSASSPRAAGRSKAFDLVIGPLDHFTWDPVASPQNIGYGFKARVLACDAGENTVTGYNGAVTLSSFTGWEGDPGFKAIQVTPATATFAKGIWSGSVTVQAKAAGLCLKAADKAAHKGYSARFDAGALSLFLTLPAQVWEHDGVLAKAGSVKLSRAVATNVTVKLTSADTTELKVPATVVVPAGKLTAAFNLTAVDDAVTDTAQTVRVSAALAGYVPAAGQVIVRPAFVKKPVLSPAGAVFAGSRPVSVTCPTAGATVRYTTDGSEVTEASPQAPAILTVAQACTLKVKGFKTGSIPSETVSGAFRKVSLVTLGNGSVEEGLEAAGSGLLARKIDIPEFTTNLTVAISGGWGDCDLLVRYGDLPDTNAYDYYPALAGNDETVSIPNPAQGAWYVLLAAGPQGFGGITLTVDYQVSIPPVDAPFITPAGGIKVGSIQVSMSCATTGAVVRYTLTGLDPVGTSTVYAAPITVGPTPLTTVKARAFKAGRPDSVVVGAQYSVTTLLKLATPITLTGALDSRKLYAIKAPAGVARMTFTLTGGTGNANLFCSKGVLPTPDVFEFGSVYPANSEILEVPKPAAGQWYYVLVHGKAAYQNAVLQVKAP